MEISRFVEPDEILTQQARESMAAFGDLYERYRDRIFRYVLVRVGDRSDAEDVTARVFVQALSHMQRYTDVGLPFSAWLYRIAHNLVANWHRDNGRLRKFLENLSAIEIDHPWEHVELVAQLHRAVDSLPLERQRLLVLKFVEELPNAEIGRLMGRSEGAVKALLHRTLGALRHALGGPYDGLTPFTNE